MTERVVSIRLRAIANEFKADMAAASKAAKDVGTQVAQTARVHQQELSNVGKALMVAGGLAVAAGGLAAKAAIDWETAWTGVTKTVDATPKQLADIEDGLRGLAKTLPESHDQIAAVAEAAGQLGVQADSIVDFTKVMVDLGETTNLTSDEAATSLAQLMNVMQTAPKDVDRLGSAVVALGNNGASTERDIVLMAQRIAGAGKIIGLSEADVLSWANALSSVGIEAEAGGSAISRVMTDIAKSVETGDDKLAIFAKTAGMSSEQFQKAFKDDPNEAIMSFVEGLGKIDAAGGSVFQTLDDLGQTDQRVSRALLTLSQSGDLLRNSIELGNQAWKDNNALTEEAEKRYKTTASQIEIAKNNINDAAIDMGQVFLPVIVDGTKAVSAFAQGIGDLPPELQGSLGSAAALTGGVALMGGAFLVALPKVVAMHDALQAMRTSMPGTTAALRGLGAVGIVVGIAAVTSNLIDQAREAAGVKATVDSLIDAYDKLGAKGAVAKGLQDNLGRGLDLGALTDQGMWSDIQTSIQKTLGTVSDWNVGMKAVGVDTALATRQIETIDKTMAAMVAAGNAAGAAEMYDELKSQTNGSSDAVARLNSLLPEYSKVQGDAKGATEEAVKATKERQIPSLDDLAHSADGAKTSVEGLSDEVRNFGSTTFDAIGAEMTFRQAIADADAAMGEDGFNKTLNLTTQSGRDNWQSLLDIASGANDYAAAAYDASGDAAVLTQKLNEGRDALVAQAMKFGASKEEAEKYADQLLATPKVVSTRVEADVSPARRAFEGLLAGYQNRTVTLRAVMDASDKLGNENGGLYSYGQGMVRAFESGGLASGIYSAGEPIYKFAERNTKFEAFLSGKSGQEERNIGLAYKSIGMLERQLGRRVSAPAGWGGGTGQTVDARQSLSVQVVPVRGKSAWQQGLDAARGARAGFGG